MILGCLRLGFALLCKWCEFILHLMMQTTHHKDHVVISLDHVLGSRFHKKNTWYLLKWEFSSELGVHKARTLIQEWSEPLESCRGQFVCDWSFFFGVVEQCSETLNLRIIRVFYLTSKTLHCFSLHSWINSLLYVLPIHWKTVTLMNIGSSFRLTQPKCINCKFWCWECFKHIVVFQYIVDRNGLIKVMIIHTHLTTAK